MKVVSALQMPVDGESEEVYEVFSWGFDLHRRFGDGMCQYLWGHSFGLYNINLPAMLTFTGSQEIAKNCKEYIVYEGTANVFTTPNCRVPSCNTDHHPFATIISLCTGTKCWSLVVTIMWDWWFVIPRCVYFPPFNHIVCICFYISYNILYEYHIMSIYLYIIYIYVY